MSVLIRGMEMPEKCGLCGLFHAEYPTYCTALIGKHKSVAAPYGMPRPDWCPLVELPKKHGRLVEFLEVPEYVNDDEGTSEVNLGDVFKAYFQMKTTPAIIEAEGAEEVIK